MNNSSASRIQDRTHTKFIRSLIAISFAPLAAGLLGLACSDVDASELAAAPSALWKVNTTEDSGQSTCAEFIALRNNAPRFEFTGRHAEAWSYSGEHQGHVLLRAVIEAVAIDTRAVDPVPPPTPNAAVMTTSFDCNLLSVAAKASVNTDTTSGRLFDTQAYEILISMQADVLSFSSDQLCSLNVTLNGEGILGLAGLLEFEAYFGDKPSLQALASTSAPVIPGLPFELVGVQDESKVVPHPGLPLEVGHFDPEVIDVIPLDVGTYDPEIADIVPLEVLPPDVVPGTIKLRGGTPEKIGREVWGADGVVHLKLR